MKEGKDLVQLAAELTRQQESKRDFVAPSSRLELKSNGDSVMKIGEQGNFEVTDITHGQIADRLSIPKKYYDKMREDAPQLLDRNVNHWFQANDEPRLVRTLDTRARAFLSDRYRPLDNFDLAEAVLPTLQVKDCEVKSCELTERRMYVKAILPKLEAEVAVGDVVQAGIVISNSEIGVGSLQVAPLIYRLVCRNGLIMADGKLRQTHLGKIGNVDAETWQVLRDTTRNASDRVFWMTVRDVVGHILEEVGFEALVGRLRESAEKKIGDPLKVVEIVEKKFGLQEGEKGSILRFLCEGGQMNQWGLVNAVTRASQEVDSYDRATELENLGGTIIDLKPSEWKPLAEAA